MAEQASNKEYTPIKQNLSKITTIPVAIQDPYASADEPESNGLNQEEHNTLGSGAGDKSQGAERESGKQVKEKGKVRDAATSKLKTIKSSTSSVSGLSKTSSHIAETRASIFASPPIEPTMTSTRLFIASLGNPPPYSSTRHSAGHILIKALQLQLQFPMFQKSKTYANGLTSLGNDVGRPEFNLWQSPSLMNVSGVALLKAYKTFMSTAQVSATDPLPGLVILYDEMETSPGQLRLRRGATSAKGHNGLKSVQQTFQSAGLLSKLGDRFVKIGIGIGRPPGGSRASGDVSDYVLGQLTGSEKQAIDGKADSLVKMLEGEWSRMSA